MVLACGDQRLVLVDVPGHRELLQNMLTGATQADGAVLVIDAVEGVRDQTRRHVAVLSLLGVPLVAVAVNKMDAIGFGEEGFAKVRRQLEGMIGGDQTHPTVVPVSASEGDNVVEPSPRMPWHQGGTLLASMLTAPEERQHNGETCLPLQDVYDVHGEKVAVGTLLSGHLCEGDRLTVWPSGRDVPVHALRRFPPSDAPAVAGEAIGVVCGEAGLGRGQVLASPNAPVACSTKLAAHVFWLGSESLTTGSQWVLRCATQAIGVAVSSVQERIDAATMENRPPDCGVHQYELGSVLLTMREPLAHTPFAACPGLGRFTLETDTGLPVAAGIIVGDGRPPC